MSLSWYNARASPIFCLVTSLRGQFCKQSIINIYMNRPVPLFPPARMCYTEKKKTTEKKNPVSNWFTCADSLMTSCDVTRRYTMMSWDVIWCHAMTSCDISHRDITPQHHFLPRILTMGSRAHQRSGIFISTLLWQYRAAMLPNKGTS